MALMVALTSAAAFLLAYGLLQVSLWRGFRDRDRQELDARLLAYWAVWQSAGADGIVDRAAAELRAYGSRPFLFVLESPTGEVLSAVIPGGWEAFDLDDPDLPNLSPGRYETLRSESKDYALIVTGMTLGDGYRFTAGISTETREALLKLYRRNLPWVLAVLISVGFVVGVLASRRFLSPILRLNEEIDRIIATGELSGRLPSPGTGDQLDGLIGRFNRMLDRIESLIGGMKDTLDAAAHDLRTPLTRIRGGAEMALAPGKGRGAMKEALADTVEQVDQAAALLAALMDIAEAERGLLNLKIRTVDLSEIVREVGELYEFVAEERGINLNITPSSPVPVLGDPVRLRQILGNLVDNAIKYGPDGGRVAVESGNDGSYGFVTVSDQGPGVSAEERERIFERLYRGDRSRGSRGLGLGLSLVKALTEAQNGRITVADAPGGGASFRLEFPYLSET